MGTKTKQIVRRLLLIPMLFLFAIPFSLFSTSIAFAATPITTSSTPDKQALSYWYYKAVKKCYAYGAADDTSQFKIETDSTKVATGILFYMTDFTEYNYLTYGFLPKAALSDTDTDGKMACTEKDSVVTKKALSFWGITGIELMCGMGFTRENGQSCGGSGSTNRFKADSLDRSKFESAFTSYLKLKIYEGKDPGTLNSPGKYSFYSTTLINACTTGSSSTKKPSDAADNAIYALKSGVDTKGTTTYSYYNATGDRVASWPSVYTEADSDKTLTCKQVLDKANDNFAAYASVKACSSNTTIAAAPNLLSACIDGANHKGGDVAYCGNTYKDSSAGYVGSVFQAAVDNKQTREACYAGQGNSGGERCTTGYTGAELSACINGAKNSADTTYCAKNYPDKAAAYNGSTLQAAVDNSKLRNACVIGQTTPGLTLTTEIAPASDCATNPTAPGCDPEGEGTSSCIIEGVGWIVCPVFKFLAGIADGTYGIIQNLLRTDVKIVTTDSGTYRAWSVMRTFANVGFVIAFLIIVFSQLSSVGITNYGVKKLLPRLVVAAILVNLSFYVTQVAVDLSNILGGSLKGLLENISVTDSSISGDALATGTLFTDITAGILGGQLALTAAAGAAAAVYFGGAGLLIPILLAAVLAIIITLFILVARQALIILLVVLSPLAFLAMLLPNTENYFKQWRKAFVALLLVYPMIALLFGASHLASAILLDSFSGSDNVLGQLVALAVLVLPLFLVPKLLQGSLNAIPAIGGFASKMASRANGLVGRQSKSGFTKSTFGRSLGIRRQAKENYRAKKFAEGVSKSGSMANILAKELPILPSQRAANKAVDRTAIASAEKADSEEVAAAEALMRSQHSDPSTLIAKAQGELSSAITAGDSVRARAAQGILLNSGGKGVDALHQTIQSSFASEGSKNSPVGQSMRAALNRAGLKSKNNALASWAYNSATIGATSSDKSTFEGLSDAELGGHSENNLRAAAGAGAIDGARAERILSNPTVAGSIGESERKFLQSLVGSGGEGIAIEHTVEAPTQSSATPPPAGNPEDGEGR